jgi:APA family basic amino acid/polyamine antiporter
VSDRAARQQAHAELGLLDCTLLVVGAVIGADVYIVAAMGASFLGPAQIIAWLAAGILAAVIALAFVQCAAIDAGVGGTYAYARKAFGPFAGFLAGLALYLGEWVALPVFPLAFANYLGYFVPGAGPIVPRALSIGLILGINALNLAGVRAGARLNDALTVAKLVPLGLLVLAGMLFVILRTDLAAMHLTPFAPQGWGGFGPAVLLIFWAYAGFELAVLPAGEVRKPRLTLPRGLLLGMAIAAAVYLLVNAAVVVARPSDQIASSMTPLADAMSALLSGVGWSGAVGPALMSVGAIISIAGVYDVFTLAVARLSFAMARDGLFPGPFARLSRGGTPWVGIVFQGASAAIGVFLVDIRSLIDAAMFFLGICYFATGLASLRLIADASSERIRIPLLRPLLVLACAGSVYLSLQAPVPVIGAGLLVMLAGSMLFAVRRGGWSAAARVLEVAEEQERELARLAARRERWLLTFGRGARRSDRS